MNCINCTHWKVAGKRINDHDEIVDVGVCKKRESLYFKAKVEENNTCEYWQTRGKEERE